MLTLIGLSLVTPVSSRESWISLVTNFTDTEDGSLNNRTAISMLWYRNGCWQNKPVAHATTEQTISLLLPGFHLEASMHLLPCHSWGGVHVGEVLSKACYLIVTCGSLLLWAHEELVKVISRCFIERTQHRQGTLECLMHDLQEHFRRKLSDSKQTYLPVPCFFGGEKYPLSQ